MLPKGTKEAELKPWRDQKPEWVDSLTEFDNPNILIW